MTLSRRGFLGSSTAASFFGAGGVRAQTGGAGGFSEPARKLKVDDSADLVVCGAGPAGVAAAVTAARRGKKVTLLESQGSLGGVWTSGLLGCLLDYGRSPLQQEILERLRRTGAIHGHNKSSYVYEPEYMKRVLAEMCKEAGVRFVLHTFAAAAYRDAAGKRLDAIVCESKSGRIAHRAPEFADCTGDGDVAAFAGCGFDIGRPQDGKGQPASMDCVFAVDNAELLAQFTLYRADWNSATSRFLEELKRAGIVPSYKRPTLYRLHGNLMLMMSNHEYGVALDDAEAVTVATERARAENHAMVDALAKLGGPWKGARMVATAEQLGHRNSRRIHGKYMLTADDVAEGRRFEDAIAECRYPVDIHGLTATSATVDLRKSKPFQLPLRALRSKDLDNLWMAGRCISGDFVAHAAYRVTGSAVATGEAVGANCGNT